MSAPITINRTQSTSVTSSSPSSPGLYVPIHKRTGGSNTSSPSSISSTLPSESHSHVYSTATLLSLQPFADESMKGKIRLACPEVLMTRKMRKGLEFNGRRTEFSAAQQLHVLTPLPFDIHEKAAATTPTPAPPAPLPQVSTPSRVVVPRRSRSGARGPQRKRNVFSSPSGARRTGDDSWRPQAVPMSPILLV